MSNYDNLFDEDNTRWEDDYDDYGNTSSHLVYLGSLEELSEETGIEEDKLYELLGEYEDESREYIEYCDEVAEAFRGNY